MSELNFGLLLHLEHIDIPKLHSLQHYVEVISSFGTTDDYNTETNEYLHIDYAKDALRQQTSATILSR
jgi:hypothetical protein